MADRSEHVVVEPGRDRSRSSAARPLRRVGLLLFALIALIAGTADAADRSSEHELRRAASWSATAARVVRAWRDGSLPERYVRRTLTIAAEELEDLDAIVVRRGDASAHARIEQATRVVRRLDAPAAARDPDAAAALVRDADRHSQALAPRSTAPR